MKNVLIIEDEEVLLDVLQKKLIREGYKVATAQDGEEGLKKMRQSRPDLILLDIMMPKKDGFGVLEEKNREKDLRAIPVIVISNSGQPVEIDRVLKLGVRDYFIKAEFDIEAVISKVKKVLGESLPPKLSEKKEAYQAPAKATVKKVSPAGSTILIVEDDKFLRELVSRKLTKEGYEIIEAADGEEALEKMKGIKPDLILLDLILPGIHGFEVLRQLKENTGTKSTPVIILTNLGQRDEVEKGIELGAEDFLIKAHHTIEEIVDKIKGVLGAKK